MSILIAWTPFLDPLPLHGGWWFTIGPLALFIAMAYKAVRVTDLRDYWKQVALMTIQTILGMIGLAVLVFVIVELILPRVVG
jgi:hypothetical protein